jgi:hypothetical protein
VGEPTTLPPIPLELYNLYLDHNNALSITLRFEDGTELALEFGHDSPVTQGVIELLERGANEQLGRLGQRGIAISGFTKPEPESE